jgi:hypothetical protein
MHIRTHFEHNMLTCKGSRSAKFVVLMTMTIKTSVIWDVKFCILVDVCPRFGRMYCLSLRRYPKDGQRHIADDRYGLKKCLVTNYRRDLK